MRDFRRSLIFSRSRSRLASWLIFGAGGMGVLIWFLIANRSKVTVQLPFGIGAWNGPLSIVILASMGVGSGWTILIQTALAARRRMRLIYNRWKQSPTDPAPAIRCDTPHIVNRREPLIVARREKIEYAGHSD
jgi:uncharacterized integral membrane protein